ncbi:Uncharacterised protein at_DN2589 [Pycnogonum litorale]
MHYTNALRQPTVRFPLNKIFFVLIIRHYFSYEQTKHKLTNNNKIISRHFLENTGHNGFLDFHKTFSVERLIYSISDPNGKKNYSADKLDDSKDINRFYQYFKRTRYIKF